ncbi:MAG: hypothetical protein SPJ12_00555, partial [Duodenibacillus sp.]|nr:hypothetical protein [Duodenibacillus sp.]
RVVLNYSPEIEKGLCLFLHSFVSCEHFVIYLSHLAQAISTPTLIGSLFEFLKSCHYFRGDKDVNHTELKSFLQVQSKNYFFRSLLRISQNTSFVRRVRIMRAYF